MASVLATVCKRWHTCLKLIPTLFLQCLPRCFKIARDADRAGLVFGSHIATGVGFWFGFQAFINIGANMGILPTKGITLPLFSYGGSSVLAVAIACGFVMRVNREVALQTESELARSVANRNEALAVLADMSFRR